MDEARKREILMKVVDGSLSPAAAAELLDQADVRPPDPRPSDDVEQVVEVKLVGAFRTTKVTGDPSVRTVVVEGGAHAVRQDGGTMVITADPDPIDEDVTERSFRFSSKGGRPRVVLGLGSKPLPLHVRMNPALPLTAEIAAGTLSIAGVHGPIRAEVSAGTMKVEGFTRPIDVNVASGTVHARGSLTSGASRIRCEAGLVSVHLEKGSNVRVRARTGLGKVQMSGIGRSAGGFVVGGEPVEEIIGDGTATLDIDSSMGLVKLSADR